MPGLGSPEARSTTASLVRARASSSGCPSSANSSAVSTQRRTRSSSVDLATQQPLEPELLGAQPRRPGPALDLERALVLGAARRAPAPPRRRCALRWPGPRRERRSRSAEPRRRGPRRARVASRSRAPKLRAPQRAEHAADVVVERDGRRRAVTRSTAARSPHHHRRSRSSPRGASARAAPAAGDSAETSPRPAATATATDSSIARGVGGGSSPVWSAIASASSQSPRIRAITAACIRPLIPCIVHGRPISRASRAALE